MCASEFTGTAPASNGEVAMKLTGYRISDLPIGKTKAYQEIRAGRLHAVKCGKITIIPPDDYERWLKSLPSLQINAPVGKGQ